MVNRERDKRMSGMKEHHWPFLFILIMLLLISGIMYVEWANATHKSNKELVLFDVCLNLFGDEMGDDRKAVNTDVLLCTQTILLWDIRDKLLGDESDQIPEYLRI